ncbi:hypothetical protein DF185_00385 [Marinifilum breve]|uniref:Beta-lactamase-related domain-containing protein n=1 Tax=Marinifilum breve TaxID=2184082 RepID=A0A2V4A1R0_9BACT|nr:serine hydrolase [Marinifilum breve]PXY02586.1 hypothetical protein DF185_00385 [Marinifilum breve]
MKSKQILKSFSILFICMPLMAFAFKDQKNKKAKNNWNIITEKIDSLLKSEIGTDSPGGSVGILYKNDHTFQRAYGLSDIENQKQNTNQTQFNLASVSKHFTAYALLLLEKDGKLQLDDPIGKYLPYLPKYKDEISIRNLIQHTSGLTSTDVLQLLGNISFESTWNQEDEIKLIRSYSKLNSPPNTAFSYSNSGYSLLAEIIENVSKMHYADFMETYVFSPLSLNSSFVFHSPNQMEKLTTKAYKKVKNKFVRYNEESNYTYGASNIFTNITDMLTWGKHILANDIPYDNYLSKISNTYNTLIDGDTIKYTYGFNIKNYKGLKQVRHSGGTLGFRSQFAFYPENDLCIVILLNTESINSYKLLNRICDIILSDKIVETAAKKRKEIKVDRKLLQSYAGKFRLPNGLLLDFKCDNDTLKLQFPDDNVFNLHAESNNVFFLKAFDAQCEFKLSPNGKVEEVIWKQGGVDYPCLKAGKIEELTPEMQKEFAGNYINKELNVTYPVKIVNNKLILSPPQTLKTYLNIGEMEIKYLGEDYFSAGRLDMLKFERNENGSIKLLIIQDVGRVKNFTLTKEN